MVNRQCVLVLTVCLIIKNTSTFFLPSDERVGYEVPSKMNFEEGSNVSIICVVKDNVFNADDLQVNFMGKPVDRSQIEILDEDRKIARVHLLNLRIVEDLYNQILRCALPDYLKLNLYPKHVVINVGRKPIQPRDVSCVIFNWSQLTCSWLPSQKYQDNHAYLFTPTYKLKYHQDDEVGPLDCPKMTPTKDGCQLNANEYTFGLPIKLNISVSNTLGTEVLNNVTFETYLIVQPGPVQDIRISSISNRSAEITWSPPNPRHNMSFYVTLTCQWHTLNITTFETHLEVDDLIPHSTYEVKVKAIPAQGGFWSDPTIKNFTTLQDVPEDHPMVARGAYEVESCGANCRNVTVLYRRLHDKHINGEGLAYAMMVRAQAPCPESLHIGHGDVMVLNTSAHHISILCRTSCSIIISITASNSNGMPQWPPDKIVIPANESMFEAPPPTVKAIDDKTVDMSWRAVDNAESYTIYWCKRGTKSHGCHPKHELNWKFLSNEGSHYRLELDQNSHIDKTNFALSVIVGNDSSPLTWATCTFDERQGGEVPQLEKATHQKFTSVSVRWSLSACPMGNHRGFVSGFNLSYCKVESCPAKDQLQSLECTDTLKSLTIDRIEKEKTIEGLTADQSYMLKISSLTSHEQSEWSAPVCHTVTDTWFKGAAIVGVAIGGACAVIFVILGIITIIYRFKSLHKWYTTGLDIKVPERHMTFSSVSSSRNLLNGQQRAQLFSRGTSQSDSEPTSERQRAYSCSTDFGEDDVFSTSLIEDDEIQAVRSPKGYVTVDSKSKHGYSRTDGLNMANRALPVPGRPLSQVPEETDLKEKHSDTCGKKKRSRSNSKTSRGSKNSHSSVTEQSEFPPVSHVMNNPHYAAPMNNNIHAF